MRKIQFRGIRTDNRKMAFGDLSTDEYNGKFITWYNYERPSMTEPGGSIYPSVVQVDPETVGQFTGKKDANGNDIYEGDFLEDIFEGKKDQFVVRWYDYSFALFGDDDRYKGSPDYMQDNLIIIGNIHEHPDLLTQKQNGEG